MVKVLVKDNKSKNVSAAIVSGLKRQVNELNSTEYNYADIMRSITLFTEYSKLISTYLGINVNIKFDIQHSSKVKVDMVNSTVPKVQLNDLNAALRSNYNMLIQIVGQIEAIYNKAFADYNSMKALYDTERAEYANFSSESSSEIEDLMEALNNTEIITNEDINTALQEATAETEAQIEEATKSAEETAQEVWDTNKGYETSSQVQEDAIKAAEEYAENSAQAHEAEIAAEAAKTAQEEADEALAALEAAKAELEESSGKFENAVNEATNANQAYDNALAGHGAALDVQNAAKDGELPAPGETVTIQGTADPNSAVTITNNGDGTYTYTVENSSGAQDTRTSTLSDIVNGTDVNNAKTEVDETSKAAQDAQQAARDAKEDYDKASDKHTDAIKEYDDAVAKAEEAKQEADDASIQYATDDELETGWQNDPTNPSDDDYGDDNWGDWSDIVGEGINDDTSGDDDE
jgi:chromosome segregation ATPase